MAKYKSTLIKTNNLTIQSSYYYARGFDSVLLDETHIVFAFNKVVSSPASDGAVVEIWTISPDGTLTFASRLEHNTTDAAGRFNSLAKIDDTHFALGFISYSNSPAYISTFSTNTSYTTITQEDTKYLGTYRSTPFICVIDSTHVLIADTRTTSGEFSNILIYSLDENYDMTLVSTFPLSTTLTFALLGQPQMIDSDHILVVYNGTGGITFAVYSISGSFTLTLVDSYVLIGITPYAGEQCSLIKLSNNKYAFAYSYFGAAKGMVKIISIADSTYDLVEFASSEFESSVCKDPSLVRIDKNHFAILYFQATPNTYIKVYGVNSDGTLSSMDSISFSIGGTPSFFGNSIIYIGRSLYSATYTAYYSASGDYGVSKVYQILSGDFNATKLLTLR